MNRLSLLHPALMTGISLLSGSVATAQAALTPPANAPSYLMKMWTQSMASPLPGKYTPAGVGAQVPQNEQDLNVAGILGSYQPAGATVTAQNAFFQSLGTNGRSCSTCHEPSSAMSINLSTIAARYLVSAGADPLFSPVDGANCPNQVPAANTKPSYLGGVLGKGLSMLSAHSLILTRGVFRIFLPVPAGAEYTISVVSDPTTCNTDKSYALASDGVTQMVSVYRRPRISTNLKFVTATVFPGPSGNIMWDGREPTFESQALDATLGHAQAATPPTADQISQMVAFETGVFSSENYNLLAGSLTALGATGGPVNLQSTPLPGAIGTTSVITPFTAWSAVTGSSFQNLQRESIYRGQQIFNTRSFTVSNVAGLNTVIGNPVAGTCSLCHNQVNSGNDSFPGAQHDIGVGGTAVAMGGPAPAKDLPIFKLTCNPGTGLYDGETILTNDPGRALITGKCADIGTATVPQLRGLAGHAPYFRDGSAPTLLGVVNFYNARFNMGLSAQDKSDLANFLAAL